MSENKGNGLFYEIEYDSVPVPGVGKYVLKSQKIEEPEKDEIRELFYQMRDISRNHRSKYDFSRFFDRRVQNDNAIIFYEQGLFMKDFEDDYAGNTQLSQYFPNYQMMGYEQLRTYFTWRTRVRKGNIVNTSLAYTFLYIYELLANIGVDDAQNGLDNLIFFWKSFRNYNKSIDKYVLQWLKDYYIYYNLPYTWSEFIEKNDLAEYFPSTIGTDDTFDLFCSISKYDIRKSVFWSDDTSQIIRECFSFVIDRIRQDFGAAGIHFDDALFRPTKKLSVWKPFKDALFYNHLKQPDRSIVLSKDEIYLCKNNAWSFSVNLTSEKGRQFISYVMKKMESTLRKIMKYRFKITANTDMINEDTIRVLTKAGLYIEKIVPSAVLEYHREATKTIVKVNHASLAKIRQEALITQEALIVEATSDNIDVDSAQVTFSAQKQNIFSDPLEAEPETSVNTWDSLKDALSEDEINAIAVVLRGDDIKAFADVCGVMLEVLVDGINEKSIDFIGDNLMDEEFVVYDDYIEQVKELIK
ncbi:MAG: hypothetical protein GX783_04720 [Clostridiales bacterium]|nr:hypothetical protein [Clostridiales bacterium]